MNSASRSSCRGGASPHPVRSPLGTFQDRLTSELRLVGADAWRKPTGSSPASYPGTIATSRSLRPSLSQPGDQHLSTWTGSSVSSSVAGVASDHTIRFDGHQFDLERARISHAGRLVEVQERFDGSLHVYADDHRLAVVKPLMVSRSACSTAPMSPTGLSS